MASSTQEPTGRAEETPATPHNPGLKPEPGDPAGVSDKGTPAKPADPDALPSDVEADPSQQPT